MLIFGARRLLPLKIYQMCPQNSFTWSSLKILAFFSKKLLNKKEAKPPSTFQDFLLYFGTRINIYLWIISVSTRILHHYLPTW